MSATTDNGAAARKRIWTTTAILAGITTLEFLIAGFMPSDMYSIKILLFTVLTLVKAYYIVSIFMHLGDEVKKLILAIGLPFAFIVWLLIASVVDGKSYGNLSITKGDPNAKPTATAPAHQPDAHKTGH